MFFYFSMDFKFIHSHKRLFPKMCLNLECSNQIQLKVVLTRYHIIGLPHGIMGKILSTSYLLSSFQLKNSGNTKAHNSHTPCYTKCVIKRPTILTWFSSWLLLYHNKLLTLPKHKLLKCSHCDSLLLYSGRKCLHQEFKNFKMHVILCM